MIQQEYKNNVAEVHGDIETTGFSIEINESMFQMLTSNVYNDPILAVMREWSTNACDACIEANKEVNFDVHLPTIAETYFSVRDYGTGLSPEDIVGLFSNLGASTKRNSNKLNGTLGIGRMAGLAVSEAFSVDSFYNGTHYSYLISMKNGVPVTMNLGSIPTEEPNGLLLSVDVSLEKIKHYFEKAENLYKFFDYKPNVNLTNLSLELDISEHISDNWFICKNIKNIYDKSNYVVMSQVLYEIPFNNAIHAQGFTNLVIKVPPGSVTFNPGRESLSLNDKTISFLNKKFDEVKKEYVKKADDALAKATNDKELLEIYKNITSTVSTSLVEEIDDLIDNYASDKLKALYNTYYPNSNKTFKHLGATEDFFTLTNNLLQLSYKDSYYCKSKNLDYNNKVTYYNFFTCHHVIIDVKTKFRAALNEKFKNKSLITWQRQSGEDIEQAVGTAKEYLDDLGISYTLVSQHLEKTFTDNVKESRQGFYASKFNSYQKVFSKSEKIENPTQGTYLFLLLNNTTPKPIDCKTFSLEQYLEAYNFLTKVQTVPVLMGVPKKYAQAALDMSNWINLVDYVKNEMPKATFTKAVEKPHISLNTKLVEKTREHNFPSIIKDYVEEVYAYNKYNNSAECLISNKDTIKLLEDFGANFKQYVPTKEIDMEVIENDYKVTYEFLLSSPYYVDDMVKSNFAKIAKLEEFYALHKTT